MKRLSSLIILLFISSVALFSQSSDADKINEEYYGLKWGCSVKDLTDKYPEAYYQNKNDDGDELYYYDTNGATRIFFFGNGQLYLSRVAYTDCTDEKAMALLTKVVDTYGKFDDSTNGSQNGSEYVTLWKDFSDTIDISFQMVAVKNKYGYNVSQLIMIDFINKELNDKIKKERIQKMQDDLEI